MKVDKDLKITIITVCKNSQQFLSETIESVINQTYKNIEYIIIDGDSTDGTKEIIQRYLNDINTWISEADSGMYDAINKGLRLATGDYILVLNSDDILAGSDTIKKAVDYIDIEKRDYYYGNMIKSNNGEKKQVKLFPVTFQQLLLSTHGTFAPHPCFFISKKINKKLGGYDLKYKYASDYDYILRALASTGSNGKYLNINITNFRIHENSITASGKIDAERKKILLDHGYYRQPFLKRFFFYYTLWIYYKIINLANGYKAG
ncbi:MAG: glycosyltransferase family 2 protein [Ginsengibacter sp.]